MEKKFKIGQHVYKPSGSWWAGRVVGFFSTEDNPDGVCVQMDVPNGPVQIYPSKALEVLCSPKDIMRRVEVEMQAALSMAENDRLELINRNSFVESIANGRADRIKSLESELHREKDARRVERDGANATLKMNADLLQKQQEEIAVMRKVIAECARFLENEGLTVFAEQMRLALDAGGK